MHVIFFLFIVVRARSNVCLNKCNIDFVINETIICSGVLSGLLGRFFDMCNIVFSVSNYIS